jgi:hypothetical protein
LRVKVLNSIHSTAIAAAIAVAVPYRYHYKVADPRKHLWTKWLLLSVVARYYSRPLFAKYGSIDIRI